MTQPPIPQSQKKKDAGRIPGAAAVTNVLEIRCNFLLPNLKQANIFFHGYNATMPAVNAALAQTLFASLSSTWSTNLATYMAAGTNPTTFFAVFVRDMTNPGYPVFQSTGAGVVGTSASPAMPENVALVLTKNLNVRGRGAKGRAYLAGWATNADGGGGTAIGAAVTAVTAFGTGVFNAIQAAGFTPAQAKPARAHYLGVTGTEHLARAQNYATVSNYVCRDNIFDSQRRRIQP